MFQLIMAYLSFKYSKGFIYFNKIDDSICVCGCSNKDCEYKDVVNTSICCDYTYLRLSNGYTKCYNYREINYFYCSGSRIFKFHKYDIFNKYDTKTYKLPKLYNTEYLI